MTTFAEDLLESLADAAAYASGEPNGCRITIVDTSKNQPDVKAIRRQLHMSQERFSNTYRIPLPTLKNWEQGRRVPDAPAVAYLNAIAIMPREIGSALNG